MTSFNFLVINRTLPDIAYRTNPPQETIHPRVIERDDGFYVYCKKSHVPLRDFLLRLAAGEPGMWVAGYRPSNGRQSTISFDRSERVSISPRLQALLDEITSGQITESVGTAMDRANGEDGTERRKSQPVKLSPDQLQARLQRQAEIGWQGELAGCRHEFVRLAGLGCSDPSVYITHVSKDDVAAGYDVRTEFNGERRCIEVKSSVTRDDGLFISENERSTLQDIGKDAFIYLVIVDEADPKVSRVVCEIQDPFNAEANRFSLTPTQWAAKLID